MDENDNDRVVAIGLFSRRDLDNLGPALRRMYPADETSCFADLLMAIDEADDSIPPGPAKLPS